jgi:hypothetical protein
MADLCYNVDSSILNYEQDRNNRDRIKTENRITEQTNLLEEQRDLLIAAINEAREGREEAERRAERTEALICRIADGIAAAARGSGGLINDLLEYDWPGIMLDVKVGPPGHLYGALNIG